jgi:hypothetical protein
MEKHIQTHVRALNGKVRDEEKWKTSWKHRFHFQLENAI